MNLGRVRLVAARAPRQPLVDEGVVGAEQLARRAVLAQDAGDEQLGLAPKRAPQVLVEIGEQLAVRQDVRHVAEVQPLTGEVLDERFSLRIGKHALNLFRQGRWVMQSIRFG